MPLRTRAPLPCSTWPWANLRRHLQAPSAFADGTRRHAVLGLLVGTVVPCSLPGRETTEIRPPVLDPARRPVVFPASSPPGPPRPKTLPAGTTHRSRSGRVRRATVGDMGHPVPALVPRRILDSLLALHASAPSQMTRVSPSLSKSFDQPRPTRQHCRAHFYRAAQTMQARSQKLYRWWRWREQPVEKASG